jgi:hypothetical protein
MNQSTQEVNPEMPIHIGEDVGSGEGVEIPVAKMLTGRAFATGKSGSGKSNSANVVAEELLKRGFALLIIDKDGEYWSLKEEYEILHAGADQECDIQVSPEHGEKLASLALEQNIPIILDLSGFFDEDEADDLIYETARHLFNKEKRIKKPFLIIAEEAHEYIPEQGGSDVANMMVRIGKRGRKRGLGLFAVSQRPQDVKKSYISQCDWLLWHRLTWDTETKVVRRVINKETANAVTDLEDGEAFLQADFLDDPLLRVQVKRMRTFDGGATPDLDGFDEPELKSVSDNLVDELEEISEREEQRQDRIEDLEARLEDRQDRVEELEDRVERLQDLRSMVESVDGIGETEAATVPGELTVEIDGQTVSSPEVIEAEVLEIREENQNLREERDRLEQTLQEKRHEIENLREQLDNLEWIDGHVDEIEEATRRLADIVGLDVDGDSDLQDTLREKNKRIQELEAEREDLASRVEELEEQSPAESRGSDPIIRTGEEGLDTLFDHDVVKGEFELAVKEGSYAMEKYKKLLATVVNSGSDGVTPQAAAKVLSVSDTTAREVMRDLRNCGFLRSEGNRPEAFYLDRNRLDRRVDVADQM